MFCVCHRYGAPPPSGPDWLRVDASTRAQDAKARVFQVLTERYSMHGHLPKDIDQTPVSADKTSTQVDVWLARSLGRNLYSQGRRVLLGRPSPETSVGAGSGSSVRLPGGRQLDSGGRHPGELAGPGPLHQEAAKLRVRGSSEVTSGGVVQSQVRRTDRGPLPELHEDGVQMTLDELPYGNARHSSVLARTLVHEFVSLYGSVSIHDDAQQRVHGFVSHVRCVDTQRGPHDSPAGPVTQPSLWYGACGTPCTARMPPRGSGDRLRTAAQRCRQGPKCLRCNLESS